MLQTSVPDTFGAAKRFFFGSSIAVQHYSRYFAGSKQNSKGTKLPIVSIYVHPVVKSTATLTI